MKRYLYFFILVLMLTSCTPRAQAGRATASTQTASGPETNTASRPDGGTPHPDTTPALMGEVSLRLPDVLPDQLHDSLSEIEGLRIARKDEEAEVELNFLLKAASSREDVDWVYALVAPFATIVDGINSIELEEVWKGQFSPAFPKAPLLVSPGTKAAFEQAWGAASPETVKVVPAEDLLETAWAKTPSWAIVPFEELGPRWKVLKVDGQSPLDKKFDPRSYPLTIQYEFNGENHQVIQQLRARIKQNGEASGFPFPITNRDPAKLSVVVMTGTTALVRKTAETMDEKGVLYPEKDIRDWLVGADILHISNEISFYDQCPPPAKRNPNFCSDPKYMELIKDIGTDVVELTGNHVLDWGSEPFLKTLKMYADNHISAYGGGKNQEEARQPAFLTDHGNRFAFIGCNASGPAGDWAGEKTPGSAACDFDWMKAQVAKLKGEGYLVIATFQHVEVCSFDPHLGQKADFGKMIQAGADIVSGSQAHCPQSMLLKGRQFVHYGLGNLFFDQMDDFAKQEFIDRHVFYDGKYISTELLTAVLEDYAKPRPMTEKERAKLLENAFRASGWIQ